MYSSIIGTPFSRKDIHSISYCVKFMLFYSIPLTDKQNELRYLLCHNDDLKKILKASINKIGNLKFLDRTEPAISSLDERKQLRMCMTSMMDQNKQESNMIIFNQYQSYGE
jgi:hypothetical protein